MVGRKCLDGTPEQTLVIHAECSTILKSLPWYIHLRPATTDYDKAMRPPAAVWLYPYNPGTLHMGRSRPKATGAWSGTLADKKFLGSWRTCCGGNRLARQSAFLRY